MARVALAGRPLATRVCACAWRVWRAALAESSAPYGIESFDDVLEPLWRGIRSLRGKVLASYLKCIGHIIPLMDAEHAFYYTREVSAPPASPPALTAAPHAAGAPRRLRPPSAVGDVRVKVEVGPSHSLLLRCCCLLRATNAQVMVVLKREFNTPDEEMKKIVLKVVKQCVATEGVESEYIKTEILPEFFKAFWNRRMALDR